ncbi:MAG: hypothetical protein B6D44_00270 [Ignavibacteriales bacterium UTCHB2]|nr:MAG: hypothetical protein B6D44_00270 [Ignavibacteriales bacterium UTCHB2]
MLGGSNILANSFLDIAAQFSFTFLLQVALIYAFPILIWYVAKPYLHRLQEERNTKRQFLRMKFNPEVFKTLLNKQKKVNIPPDDLGINLGNSTAENTIIKICNPYCYYCVKSHKEIDQLLEENKNVKVKIIFKSHRT